MLGPDSDINLSYSTREAKKCWFISWWVNLFCVLGTEEIPMKQCGSCSNMRLQLLEESLCFWDPVLSPDILLRSGPERKTLSRWRSTSSQQEFRAGCHQSWVMWSPAEECEIISRAQGTLLVRIFLSWSLASSKIPCRGPTRGLLPRAYLPEL